ncbi:hypothetical protein BCR44DRAFT_1440011 [Catenaria anguillulae PL171]|uniref:Uncharacterized protein n=1 Tax=Catenaria anguillulae PL171 TaxID=765915 RepID=A0A1Y2HES3_9FUNG|nr:hypothetical protein BCR44DRAFT_1440011 [Catenaria anguillulae PL171]
MDRKNESASPALAAANGHLRTGRMRMWVQHLRQPMGIYGQGGAAFRMVTKDSLVGRVGHQA